MECPLSSQIERIMVGELPARDLKLKKGSKKTQKQMSGDYDVQKRSADYLRVNEDEVKPRRIKKEKLES